MGSRYAFSPNEVARLLRCFQAVRAGLIEPARFVEALGDWAARPSDSTDLLAATLLSTLDDSDEETTLYPPGDTSDPRDEPPIPLTSARSSHPRYRVLEGLALGGLGAVDRAWDLELGREVALKRMRTDRAGAAEDRARFLREGWITAGLEHPGVVPVHGRGRFPDGQPFFAMRLVRGQTLRQAITRLHGHLANPAVEPEAVPNPSTSSLRALVGRLVQACQAVEYAHSRGIIHRDLKPENILLGPFGETLVVDWGLAKPLAHADLGLDHPSPDPEERTSDLPHPPFNLSPDEFLDHSPRPDPIPMVATGAKPDPESPAGGDATRPGQIQGTIAYMSPEQARGEHSSIGPRSDVYSLGATLHELLTGKPPLSVEGRPSDALTRVALGALPSPGTVRPGVDPELERICLKSMARDPAHRYHSAGALAAALEEWLAEERAEAVRRLFTAALSAYGTLVFIVQDRLRPIPAAHSIREDLLNRAIRGLENLVDHAGRDHAREVARSLASAYQQIADLEQQLGRTPDARRHYELALRSLASLAGPDLSTADPRDLGPLSITLGKLGDILRRQGELVAAHEHYLRGLELTRSLASLDLRSTRARRGLEIVLGKLSSLSRQMGDHDGARRYQEESLAISFSLYDASPNDPRARRGMAISLGRHGDVCREAGDLEAARDSYSQGFELSEALLRADPLDLTARRGLAIACNKLAEVARLLGDLPGARDAALRGLQVADELAAEDPWNVPARRDLAIACNRLGDIDREAGLLPSARDWFLRGLELMRSLVDADPADAHARRGLLLALLRLGELHLLLTTHDDARDCLSEALVFAETLALAEAHDAQAQLDVARACQLLGRLEIDTGSPERSALWFSRGVGVLHSLRERNRLAPGPARLLEELEADLTLHEPHPGGFTGV